MQIQRNLDLDDALRRLLDGTHPLAGATTTPLRDALGRVLAATVTAPIDLPPYPASAMDGYALRSVDVAASGSKRLRLIGTSFAGRAFNGLVAAGECVRIFTGAPIPAGADAIVIQERCQVDGDTVVIEGIVAAGDHVRPVGHDVSSGAPMLSEGRRLNAFDVAWLAAVGIDAVMVRDRPTVGMFSTGDELCEPGATLGEGQVYDANRTALRALLAALPVTVLDFGIVPDSPAAIIAMLADADRRCDLVITSGGVSVGDADHVKPAVETLGTLQLWKLNLKPGKPLAYGRLRRAAFFGLPGNPVSAVVTLLMIVRPVLEKLCGAMPSPPLTLQATLRHAIDHEPGREEFQRATLTTVAGEAEVSVSGDQSSNRLASFAAANCLIRIGKACGDLPAGSKVTVLPFNGLL
jgi:molybdopterin molybdotransferase